MRDLKYIIVQLSSILEPKAIIFNGEITHNSMVPRGYKVISAGFCIIYPHVKVYGESTSLNIKSKESDADAIYKTLTRNHII